MIDWTKPIEAVHEDGRVVPVTLESSNPDCDGDYCVDQESRNRVGFWFFPGSGDPKGGWIIRNRFENFADELAELRAWRDAAIAKHPDLAPVDPDLIEARRIATERAVDEGCESGEIERWYSDADPETNSSVGLAMAGIKRGRELERAAIDSRK